MSPLLGIAAGTIITWGIALLLDVFAWTGELHWALRVLAISTSAVMWALFTSVLQDKQLYGGGLYAMEPAPRAVRRVWYVRIAILVLWALSISAVSSHNILVFWVLIVLQLGVLVGEVGWRDPWLGVLTVMGRRGGQ